MNSTKVLEDHLNRVDNLCRKTDAQISVTQLAIVLPEDTDAWLFGSLEKIKIPAKQHIILLNSYLDSKNNIWCCVSWMGTGKYFINFKDIASLKVLVSTKPILKNLNV